MRSFSKWIPSFKYKNKLIQIQKHEKGGSQEEVFSLGILVINHYRWRNKHQRKFHSLAMTSITTRSSPELSRVLSVQPKNVETHKSISMIVLLHAGKFQTRIPKQPNTLFSMEKWSALFVPVIGVVFTNTSHVTNFQSAVGKTSITLMLYDYY